MKYRLTFEFLGTEKEASEKASFVYNNYSAYMKRKYKKPHFTPWESEDRKQHLFVLWYYV